MRLPGLDERSRAGLGRSRRCGIHGGVLFDLANLRRSLHHVAEAFSFRIGPRPESDHAGNLMAQPAANPQAGQTDRAGGEEGRRLIRAYTARIEKEIEQGRKEVERLRAELHELIDVRYAMADAIAELRGELATKGTYSGDPVVPAQAAPKAAPAAGDRRCSSTAISSTDLAVPCPKSRQPQQREQLRRLAPRADLKRMIERLRAEVDETRAEVDQLAYKLLELSAGMPASFQGMGGG